VHDLALQHGAMVDFGAGDNQSDYLSDPEAAFGFDERTPAAYIFNGTAEVLILGSEIDRLVIRFSRMSSHVLISLNLSRFRILQFVIRNQFNPIAV
jgi:hypothetical protein